MSSDDSWLELVEQSYNSHIAVLIGYAATLTGSQFIAQDICHEVFRKLISEPKDSSTLSLKYLTAAIRNESRNAIRSHRRAQRYHELYLHQTSPATETCDDEILSEESWSLLSQLSPKQRDVIYLWCHGLTYKQIGDAMTIAEKTVHTHLERAKNALRRYSEREREREREREIERE